MCNYTLLNLINIRTLISATFVFALILLISSGWVRGDIGLESSQATPSNYTFERVLASLIANTSDCIIAEDQPVDYTISQVALASITNGANSTTEKVKAVASHFDYSVKHQGNLYLLIKRFTSKQDLPDLSLEECYLTFQSIKDILGKFEPVSENHNIDGYYRVAKKLLDSLNGEQLALLKEGKLRAVSLTSEQQLLAAGFSLRYYAGHYQETAGSITDEILKILNSRAKLIRASRSISSEITISPHQIVLQRSISSDQSGDLGDNRKVVQPNNINGQETGHINYFTIPGAILASGQSSQDDTKIVIDEAFRNKHITVIGAKKIGKFNLMKAVAEIYGLRLIHQKDQLRLTRYIPPTNIVLNDAVKALRMAIPNPVLRCLHLQEMDYMYAKMITPETAWKAGTYDEKVGERVLTTQERQNREEYLKVPYSRYESAFEQLSTLLSLAEERNRVKETEVNKMGLQERSLLANVLMWRGMAKIVDTLYTLPPTITSFNNVYLIGGKMNIGGKAAFGLGVLSRDPNGPGSIGWGFTRYRIREEKD